MNKIKLAAFSVMSLSISPVFAGTISPTPVPEPSTIALMGAGVAAILFFAKKRKK